MLLRKPGLHKRPLCLAILLLFSQITAASDDDNIQRLRAEFAQKLDELRQQYDAKIEQVRREQQRAVAPKPEAISAPVAQATAAASSAFNPAVSVILQGNYRYQPRSLTTSGNRLLDAGRTGEAHSDDTQRGFSLDATELVLSAAIDPLVKGLVNLAMSDGSAEVEEAWVQSTSLPYGLVGKAGRFLSEMGYLNKQHPHAWDFADAPLMYSRLVGEHLSHDGVQLRWLAPLAGNLELGIEAGQGQATPGASSHSRNDPGVVGWFVKWGDDIGDAHSWQLGLGQMRFRPNGRSSTAIDQLGIDTTTSFTGKTALWVADAVYKWSPNGNTREQQLKLQAEWFTRRDQGILSCADNLAAGGLCNGEGETTRAKQQGGYLAGVWKWNPSMRLGYRYDWVGKERWQQAPSLDIDGQDERKHSLMLDYSPSEFSRWRLQWSQNRLGSDRNTATTLQYIHSLGSHGAHRY